MTRTCISHLSKGTAAATFCSSTTTTWVTTGIRTACQNQCPPSYPGLCEIINLIWTELISSLLKILLPRKRFWFSCCFQSPISLFFLGIYLFATILYYIFVMNISWSHYFHCSGQRISTQILKRHFINNLSNSQSHHTFLCRLEALSFRRLK